MLSLEIVYLRYTKLREIVYSEYTKNKPAGGEPPYSEKGPARRRALLAERMCRGFGYATFAS